VTLSACLSALHIPEAEAALSPYWDDSQACFPADIATYLQPAHYLANRRRVGLPEELDPLLEETARLITASPELSRLLWHCYRLLYVHRTDYASGDIGKWPYVPGLPWELQGLPYLLLALEAVPLMEAFHQQRGIPTAVTDFNCLAHAEVSTRRHKQHQQGRWGVELRTLYWLRNHVSGDLYRMGRFEYMVKPFSGRLQAYRHQATGRVVALAADGLRFTPDGYQDADANSPAMQAGWTSQLTVTATAVTGQVLRPSGQATPQEVTLSLDEWQPVLLPGDPMLEIHIPAGGGMTPEACRQSFAEALEFFPRYFPDRPFKGFACYSWILNPQIAEWYSKTSNMILWQQELYCFPWPSGGMDGLYFLFGESEIDLQTAPRDTSIQRAAIDHLQAGGRLRCGGAFMLTEDFPHYGTQFYLREAGD
jgi:hypothetical protein